jgi:predicted nucleotidyltransferase
MPVWRKPMSRRMTVVFHNDDLYTDLKVAAVRRRLTASEIISEAVTEWLERREDASLLPIINEARSEYQKKGGRPWNKVSREVKQTVNKRNGTACIKIPRAKIAEFCRRHHIQKLSFFGSVLTDAFKPDSDIDVLVEFEAGHTPGWDMVSVENELSTILGHKVDLHTKGDLSKYFRDSVVREAQVQYAAK